MDTIIINQTRSSNLWGISLDALLSASIAIIVFILGYIFNKLYENWKEKKRLKGIEIFFWTLLDSLIEPTTFQLKQYREIANKINDKFEKDFIYFENPHLNIKLYRTINPVDLHKIFFSKKKVASADRAHHFNTIVKTLEFIDSQMNSIKQNINQFFKDFRSFESDWKVNIDGFFNLYESYISFNRIHEIPSSKDEFLKQVDRLVYSCTKVEKFPNEVIVYENLIEPLLQLIKQFPNEMRINEIKPYLIGAKHAFSNLMNVRKIYNNLFSQEAKSLEKEFNVFQSSVDLLRNV